MILDLVLWHRKDPAQGTVTRVSVKVKYGLCYSGEQLATPRIDAHPLLADELLI